MRIKIFYSVLVVLALTIRCQANPDRDKSSYTAPYRAKGVEMSEVIKLPSPERKGNLSLEETLIRRESVRSFARKALTHKELSQLLWSAYGKKDVDTLSGASRTVPSAGARYPMELFVVGEEGIFQYIPFYHTLKQTIDKDQRRELAQACWGQGFIAQAPVNIVITCVYERITLRYRERGKQYAHMEAGHMGQNISLQAVRLGLGTVMVGAFEDRAVQKALGLPEDHIPLYVIPVGYPK